MIYIAAPNDQALGNGHIAELKALAVRELASRRVPTYDPISPFGSATLAPARVVEINNHAVDTCDGMLAILPNGIPSVGVPMEIQRAASQRKPVAVLGSSSMMLTSYPCIASFDADEFSMLAAAAWLEEQVYAQRTEPAGLTIHWKGDELCAPVRNYTGDAGFDLVVSEDTRIPVGGFADVDMGIRVELPSDMWAMLTGRSSTIRRRGTLVTTSIIDNGYRGPIFAGCQNMSERVVELKRGERIAQMIPYTLQAPDLRIRQVTELTPTDRGSNGFGSTGK